MSTLGAVFEHENRMNLESSNFRSQRRGFSELSSGDCPPCQTELAVPGAAVTLYLPVQNSNRSATCITRLSVRVRVYTPKESGLSIRLLMDMVSKRTLLVTLKTSQRSRKLTRSVTGKLFPKPASSEK